MKLLSTSTKTEKTEAGIEVLYAMLYLQPSLNYKLFCAGSTAGCRPSCLIYSGMMRMPTQEAARIKRTQFYLDDREAFITQLHKEIKAHIRKSNRLGVVPALRLNGTQDLDWSEIYEAYPEVQFQEYTKVHSRAKKLARFNNLNITFSKSERMSETTVTRLASKGHQVAVVFDVKPNDPLPDTYLGFPVIDADKHDARWIEDSHSIAGLRVKGTNLAKEAARASGFAVSVAN